MLRCLPLLGLVLGSFAATYAPTAGSSTTAAPPPPAPPRAAGTPPSAWVETERGARWLGYSSYCWRGGLCVDHIAPACDGLSRAPRLPLRRGERLRFHLGFAPREITLAFANAPSKPIKLVAGRITSWRADRAGAFTLFAAAKGGGDASYVSCIVWQ